MFVGSFCSFCPICGLRGGVVFSGPLPEGWALAGQVGRLLCLQDEKKGEKNGKRGRAKWGFGKAFASPSTLSYYRFSIHTSTYRHTRTAEPSRQSQDVTSAQEEKPNNFFSPYCIVSCREKLETLGLLLAGSKGEDLEELEGGAAAGSVLHREFKVKECSAWILPELSTTFHPILSPLLQDFSQVQRRQCFCFFFYSVISCFCSPSDFSFVSGYCNL